MTKCDNIGNKNKQDNLKNTFIKMVKNVYEYLRGGHMLLSTAVNNNQKPNNKEIITETNIAIIVQSRIIPAFSMNYCISSPQTQTSLCQETS